ncbi:unnamed protein product [Gongylonema pulchrum]|uniref:DFP domain-containing protein n=1 Tax=Gongylonema pulchrum TaxID=637853 RepID=A0A183E649_9BILA|nr:unnamed protein product [Gongylonema pulchrum]
MPGLVEAIKLRQECSDRLLMISFDDVSVYLSLLEAICTRLRPFGPSVLVYLAAAVSDFYLSEDNLVSFKDHLKFEILKICLFWITCLETDESMLIVKSRQALETYGHQLVIGNILMTRKERVVFVTQASKEEMRLSDQQKADGIELEQLIVDKLVVMHSNLLLCNGDSKNL